MSCHNIGHLGIIIEYSLCRGCLRGCFVLHSNRVYNAETDSCHWLVLSFLSMVFALLLMSPVAAFAAPSDEVASAVTAYSATTSSADVVTTAGAVTTPATAADKTTSTADTKNSATTTPAVTDTSATADAPVTGTPATGEATTAKTASSVTTPSVSYDAYVQDSGWQKPVSDGTTAGTVGESKRLEAITISLPKGTDGSISYQTHVQNIGWQASASNGAKAGTTGQSLRLEAIKVWLTGNIANDYDVYYRVQVQDYGWLDWAKDGAEAGTTGLARRMEALEILLRLKTQTSPGPTDRPCVVGLLDGSGHVQSIGWQTGQTVPVDTVLELGTEGQGLRLEALLLHLSDTASGAISYLAHVADIGWQGNLSDASTWASDGAIAGTTGRARRIEAVCIALSGEAAKQYDIYYQAHVQDYGWLDWASNGAVAGTTGLARRLEALKVMLVSKGAAAPGATSTPYVQLALDAMGHVQNIGWQSGVRSTVGTAISVGTTGHALRLEAFLIRLGGGLSGAINYSAHVEDIGWQKTVSNGAISGTTGRNLRIEAIQITLSGLAADMYDIYYRVHVSCCGWLGWACNGQQTGSTGLFAAIESVELMLKAKGTPAPGATSNIWIKAPSATVSVENLDNDGGTYDVAISNVASAFGVSQLVVPTWCWSGQSDLITYAASLGSGVYRTTVEQWKHFFHTGAYRSDVYLVGGNGVSYFLGSVSAAMTQAATAVFQVISDLQLESDSDTFASHFLTTLSRIKANGTNGIVINGDLTEWSTQYDYNCLFSLISRSGLSKSDFTFVSGNHELRTENGESFATLQNRYISNTGVPGVYYSTTVAGQDFIVLGSDLEADWWVGANLSQRQLTWLDSKLAQEKAAGKVCYVFLHQPLANTVVGSASGSWATTDGNGVDDNDAVYGIVEKYSNVIMFSSHTHYALEVSNCYRKDFSSPLFVNTAASAYLQSSDDSDGIVGAEGWYVFVLNNKILLRGYNFLTDSWITRASYTYSF